MRPNWWTPVNLIPNFFFRWSCTKFEIILIHKFLGAIPRNYKETKKIDLQLLATAREPKIKITQDRSWNIPVHAIDPVRNSQMFLTGAYRSRSKSQQIWWAIALASVVLSISLVTAATKGSGLADLSEALQVNILTDRCSDTCKNVMLQRESIEELLQQRQHNNLSSSVRLDHTEYWHCTASSQICNQSHFVSKVSSWYKATFKRGLGYSSCRYMLNVSDLLTW